LTAAASLPPSIEVELNLRKIVGGGTAGLTLGLRLTQNTSLSVAVIEAGSFYEFNNMNYSQIPAFDGKFETAALTDYQPLIDWGVVTVPQSVSTL
jgi:choline dehydrogenase